MRASPESPLFPAPHTGLLGPLSSLSLAAQGRQLRKDLSDGLCAELGLRAGGWGLTALPHLLPLESGLEEVLSEEARLCWHRKC